MWHAKASVRLEKTVEAARAFHNVLENEEGLKLIKSDNETVNLALIAFEYGAITLMNPSDDYLKEYLNTLDKVDDTTAIIKAYFDAAPDTITMFLKDGIKVDPTREQSYVLLGRHYISHNKFDKASQLVDNLAKVNPDAPDVSYLKGRIFLGKKSYDSAATYLLDAIKGFSSQLSKLNEKTAATLNEASGLNLEPADIDKMISAIHDLEASKKEVSAEDKIELLKTKYNLSDPNARYILRQFSSFTGKKRQLAEAYDYLGQCYFSQSKYAEADSAFTKVIEADQNKFAAYFYKGLSLYYMKSYEKSIAPLIKFTNKIANNYHAELFLGLAYLKMDKPQPDKAEQALLKAKDIKETADVYRALASACREQGKNRNKDVQKYIKKAMELEKK